MKKLVLLAVLLLSGCDTSVTYEPGQCFKFNGVGESYSKIIAVENTLNGTELRYLYTDSINELYPETGERTRDVSEFKERYSSLSGVVSNRVYCNLFESNYSGVVLKNRLEKEISDLRHELWDLEEKVSKKGKK